MKRSARVHELLGSLPSGARPLEGKSVYMHAVKRRHSAVLTDVITQLGGSVEAFLNRDVWCLVTGRREGQKDPPPLSSMGGANPPPVSSMGGAKPSIGGAKSVTKEDGSLTPTQRRHPASPNLVAPLCGSRGRALLEKAMHNNERCHSNDVLSSARSWGVRILHVDDFIWCLDLLTERSKQKRPQAKASEAPAKRVVKAGALKTPFIKVEDSSRRFRPVYSHSMSVPELNYGARFSPFEPPASHAHKAKHTPQEPPVPQAQNRDGSPCGSADLAPPPTAPPLRRKSSGYCECCQMAFTDMEQHVKCEQHLRFAEHSANYAVLDQLIGSLECLFLFSTAHSQDFQLSSSSSQCILVTSDLELKMSGQINQDALTHSHTHTHTHTHSPEKLAVTHTLSHAQNSQVQTHTHTLTHTHRPENSTQQTIPYPDTPTLSDTANPPTLNPPTLNHPTLNPPTLNPPTLSDTPTVNPEHSEEEEEQGEERKMKPLPSQSHTPVVPHTNPSDPSHLCKSLPSQGPSHTPPAHHDNPSDHSHILMPLPSQGPSHTPPAHHDTPSDPSHLCMPLPSQGPSHTPPAHHDNPSDHSHILMPLPSVTFSPTSSSAAVMLLVEHKMGAEPRENQANRLEVGVCVETLKSDWPSERTDPSPPVLLPCQPECDTSLRKRSQVECANPAPKRRRTAFESLRTPPPPLTPPPHLVTSCPTDLEPPLLHPYFHYDTPPEAHQQCPSSPPSLSPCPSPHPSYPPWSSESDWDRGLLLRLTPAVPAPASEGRQRAELELMLLQSCTGLKDGSYHSRLCTALS